MSPKCVQDLKIWRDSISLVKSVYAATRVWPRDETYGLTSQTRRAAVSIPANIAEGRSRDRASEIRRFGQIALGSAYELDTLLVIASELGYIEAPGLRSQLETLTRRIQNFMRYQESKLR